MAKIQRALISVSDKRGIVEFARGLGEQGVEIISTGGTARVLKEANIRVRDISELTGFPEILGGRVKTLHPKVHGGLLGIRDNSRHRKEMEKQGIEPIDMVVVNLYPFQKTISRPGATLEEAIENIDIGGPSMIRSAAKNFQYVAVVTSPEDYTEILGELEENEGNLRLETRKKLAVKAFALTFQYDEAIYNYLNSKLKGKIEGFPQILNLRLEKVNNLRYGENPHQKAAFYKREGGGLIGAKKLQGKELSFNNLLDLDAAWETAREFEDAVAVVIKHTNPCGVAGGKTLVEAYRRARATDPVSAFGSVVGLNRKVDGETAREITSTFVEAVIAPGYQEEALKILAEKENLRVMETQKSLSISGPEWDFRKISGGFLIQEKDISQVKSSELKVVTRKSPEDKEFEDLLFAWRVVKHIKSNAIVLVKDKQTTGIGAGQMSRVDAVKLAIMKANFPTQGTVLASDAFFPFRDVVDEAAKAGVVAIIQPGGSLRDKESIIACDEHGISMVFTGMRHFRH